MKNKRIGLALGSGAARGFAHMGVIQVLEENNVPIDAVSGCSMGAIVGSAFCAGADMYIMTKLMAGMENKSVFDIGISKKGLIRGERFEELIRMFTKGKNIEDLSVPFAAVACDIQNGALKTFLSGSAYKAVRASISIPGMFVPYEIDGRQYVDGCVIERVPVEACRALGADIVIAVDVGYSGRETGSVKNVFEVVSRALDIMQWELTKERLNGADITISPDVSHIKPYSNAQAEECVEIGRKAAIEAMPKILQLLEGEKISEAM